MLYSTPHLIDGKEDFGSPGRIRTYSLSVNSRTDRKSKCPIWCRLREIGSHFFFFSCTHTCTHGAIKYPFQSTFAFQSNAQSISGRCVNQIDKIPLMANQIAIHQDRNLRGGQLSGAADFFSFSSCSLRSSCQRAYCSALAGSGSSSSLSQKRNQSTFPCCDAILSSGFCKMC